MPYRLASIVAACLLTCLMWFGTAHAQPSKQQAPATPSARKPVIEYIVVVVLLAIPIGLVCRSSRRQT